MTEVQDGQDAAPLLRKRDGFVETWTLNRPQRRNPISDQDLVEALATACGQANRDPGIRAIVLTGAGSAFSSGGDVGAMARREGYFGGPPHVTRDGYRRGIQQIPRAMMALDVPIIAAVNGPAYGAGCDLTLLCDLRIASPTAQFAESFVKVGLIPGDGGAWLLPRLVGPARAALMTLTGEPIDAQTALDWGLVVEVVAADELLPRAHDLAERIAANPPHPVRAAKRLLRESDHVGLETMLELSAAMQAAMHQTADHLEAVTAFTQKRKPEFTGD